MIGVPLSESDSASPSESETGRGERRKCRTEHERERARAKQRKREKERDQKTPRKICVWSGGEERKGGRGRERQEKRHMRVKW